MGEHDMIEGGLVVAFITAPHEKGREIAKVLLEKRLVACVNIASVKSMYWWKGKIEDDHEDLLVVKTTMTRVKELIEEVKKVHPYTVPEVVVLPVVACLGDYCKWAREETDM